MANDPVQVYLDSSTSLDKATHILTKMIRTITDAAEKLRDPSRVAVLGPGLGIQPHLVGTSSTIDAEEWPSAQQLHQALFDWQKADEACRIAWGLVPKPRRSGLQPPPGESS